MKYTVEVEETKTCWYKEGTDIRHREDGPAIELADGSTYWCLNGERHREDGPTIEWPDGSKWWFFNGILHREDGPAIEWSDGSKEWHLNGEKLTEEEFNSRKSMNSITINGKTKEIPQEALDLLKDLL